MTETSDKNMKFIACGLILAVIIAIAAVFLASGDPDGLESTALYTSGQKTLDGSAPEDADAEAIGTGTFEYSAPMPDYSITRYGDIGSIAALLIGIIAVFGIIFGVSKILKRKA